MDGWRGSRLGYAGGRTGYFGAYSQKSGFFGTGMGQSNSNLYNRLKVSRDTTTNFVAGLGLVYGLYMLADYRGRNRLLKQIKKAPVVKQVSQGTKRVVDGTTKATGIDKIMG